MILTTTRIHIQRENVLLFCAGGRSSPCVPKVARLASMMKTVAEYKGSGPNSFYRRGAPLYAVHVSYEGAGTST